VNSAPSPRERAYVLHVCDYAAPYKGSFIRQLELLDDELGARGSGRSAFAFPPAAERTDWFVDMAGNGRPVYTLPPTGARALGKAHSAVRALLGSTGCHIVHSHFLGYDLPSALAVARERAAGDRRALIWHYRTALECAPAERSLAQRLKDGLKFRWLGSGVDRHVAVTEALAREAAARGADGRVSAVVAGCDTDAFQPDPDARRRGRAALDVADDEMLVLHFGWHWKRKGGDVLVAAAKLLADRGVAPLRFVSVGAPPHEVAPPVRHIPFTGRIAELHQAADIFVSASRSEGFGNGLMEAFASGTPAVATLVEGQRELFENVAGCVCTAPGDAAGIAEAIESLLDQHADWPQLGAANRRHVVRHYSMRDWARRMADLYEEVAAR
jgi:glycosyltransferase involved in cell wall biosynthesis